MSASNERFAKWNRQGLYPVYAAALTLLLYLILFAISGILGYGNNTILSGDLYQQYVAFIRLFLDMLKDGGDTGYSFSLYLGSPTASTFAYYCLSPFNLLYLLPGVSTAAMTTVVIILKHALAAAAFQLFAQKGLKRTSPVVILFSAAYAMCGFAVTMQIHIMWLDALYILPILILLLLRFVRGGSFLPLAAAYAYLFFTNFYMGYIVGIFSALCFAALLVIHTGGRDKIHIADALKKTGLFTVSVLLAAGCCAAVLLPAASQLLGQRSGDPMGLRYVSITLTDVLGNLFAGQMQSMGSPVPLLYCGLPVVLLLPVYFLSKNISRKEKIAVSAILLLYLAATQFLPIYAFLHAFEAPNWYAHRYAFCISFLLITLSLRALPEGTAFSGKQYGIYAAALLLFYSILIPVQRLSLGGYTTSSPEYLLLNGAFLGAYLLCLSLYAKKRHRLLPPVFALLFSAELVCNGYADLSRNSFSIQTEDSIQQQDRLEAAAISGIRSADPGLYRIRVFGEGLLNAPSYHHYAGLNTFVTYDNEKLRNFMSSLGIAAPFMQLIDQGYTDLTDMLFGIRYAVFLQGDSLGVSPMPHALPIAFLSSPEILSWQDTGNPFLNQELLINALSGTEGHYFTPVSFENVDTYSQNMNTLIIDNVIYYQHIADSALNGVIRYSIHEENGRKMYGYVATGGAPMLDTTTATLEATASPFSLPHYLAMQTIAEANGTEDGTRSFGIEFAAGPHFDTAVSDVMLYTFDDSGLDAVCTEMAGRGLQITSWSEGAVSGMIECDAEHPILFTTIPYDRGWTAVADGQPVPVYAAANDTFLCLYLEPGTHSIELKYEDPLAAPGIMVSTVCIVAFLLLALLAYRKKQSIANKISQKDTAEDAVTEEAADEE